METLTSDWILVCVCLAVLTVGIVALMRQRGIAGGSGRSPRETPTVALVRRRRELSAQLREMAGDGGADLLRAEARRIGAGLGSLEALEAAVARAERNTASAELISTRMASLSGGTRR